MNNILVVDDEKEIADLIEIYLKNEGFNVLKYYDSTNILEDIKVRKIDLAILDVMMEPIDGFTLCEKMRQNYSFPIIFVTAKEGGTSKINGLLIGADDYVTKPFEPLELVARVKAQLRRSQTYNQVKNEGEIIIRGLSINKDTFTAFLNGKKLNLTKTEFAILYLLCENKGKVVKNDDIFLSVWQEDYFEKDNNTIMVHIRHLRSKMNDTKKNPKYIKTIWGVGYIIDE